MAAMSQSLHDEHVNALLIWASTHEVGDTVEHWQTGRRGTVTAVHPNGVQIYIKFDLFNLVSWKWGNDGWNEMRKKHMFIVTMKRTNPFNAGCEAAKRARLHSDQT